MNHRASFAGCAGGLALGGLAFVFARRRRAPTKRRRPSCRAGRARRTDGDRPIAPRKQEADRRQPRGSREEDASASASTCRPASSRPGWSITQAAVPDRSSPASGSPSARWSFFKSGSLSSPALVGGDRRASACPISCWRGCARAASRSSSTSFPNALDIIVRGVKRRPAARRHAAHHRQRSAGAGASRNSARSSKRRRSACPCPRPWRRWRSACRSTETNFFAIVIEIQSQGRRQSVRSGRQPVQDACATARR